MTHALLIKRIKEARQKVVEVAPGKSVTVERPSETQMLAFFRSAKVDGAQAAIDLAHQNVVGWSGFTEADLLPPGQGSDEVLAFDPALWAEVIRDRVEWIGTISETLTTMMGDHAEKNKQAEKN